MIDVICVNWNSGPLIEECIGSVLKYRQYYVGQIIVVDNGSTDGSCDSLEGIAGVQLVRLEENLGFARACNIGAKYATADYLLFLNPDARVFPNTFAESHGFLEKQDNAEVGVLGARLLDDRGVPSRSCARFPSAGNFIASSLGLDRLFPNLGYLMTNWDHESTRDVDHVIGAFYLVRRKLFEQLGGFDERFFVYLEDLDVSYRVKQEGWRVVYLATAVAYHEGGGTSKNIKARRLFYALRSRLLYADKHFSRLPAVLVTAVTLGVEPIIRSVHSLLRFSYPSFAETLSAYRWLILWLIRK